MQCSVRRSLKPPCASDIAVQMWYQYIGSNYENCCVQGAASSDYKHDSGELAHLSASDRTACDPSHHTLGFDSAAAVCMLVRSRLS